MKNYWIDDMSFLTKLFFGDVKKREEEWREAVAAENLAKQESLRAQRTLLQQENIKKFPFIDSLEYIFTFSEQEVVCDCCKKKTRFYSEAGIYAEEFCEFLCVDCIASGNAAERYRGTFNTLESKCNSIDDEETVLKKTPSLPSNQEYSWKVCCGKPCVYLKRATYADMEELFLWDKLKETFHDEIIPFEDLQELVGEEEDDSLLMLFRCKECGKIYAIIDLE